MKEIRHPGLNTARKILEYRTFQGQNKGRFISSRETNLLKKEARPRNGSEGERGRERDAETVRLPCTAGPAPREKRHRVLQTGTDTKKS